jgi:prepilin peptidase CpaA
VSLVVIAGFVLLAIVMNIPLAQVGMHLVAALLVLAITFGFFSRGWIGGGDAKLAAATALWFGFGNLLEYSLYASLIGGALTLLILQFRLMTLPPFLEHRKWVARLHHEEAGVPYGIALATAALLVYPHTFWMNPAA